MIRVSILGFGNIGHAVCALLGRLPTLDVTVWGRSIASRQEVDVVGLSQGRVACAGRASKEPDLRAATQAAEVIIVATPAYAAWSIAERALRHARSCKLLVVWEGTGQSVRRFGEGLSPGFSIAGLQRSPIIAQIAGRDKSVEIHGIRSRVVAALLRGRGADRENTARAMLQSLIPCQFVFAPDYDCVTLSPGNPMIHTARLYRLGEMVEEGAGLPASFYTDWDDRSSVLLLKLHGELTKVRDRMGISDRFVTTLLDRPQSPQPREITREIRAETVLGKIPAPVLGPAGAARLDGAHRFFRDDIAEGLPAITALARRTGIRTPMMDKIIAWGMTQMQAPAEHP
ncbi:MAG: NAD/NADP octopine/nopaline dehydrogenase family protein [Rhodobacter sp.]|nr:NAD/NADP octopine/nopaline dehydrogenase family protein [Rhodobacter sp.]